MLPGCSLRRTVRQLAPIALGLTQASRVMPVVRSRLLASPTLRMLLLPLKLSALPYLPPLVQVAPAIVPVLPLPERSARLVPEPASKLYEATRPVGGGVVVMVAVASLLVGLVLPAASSACAL